MWNLLFGNLTLAAIEHGPIVLGAQILMIVGAFAVIGFFTYFKLWKWLWRDWITSLDAKKIGIMYIVVAVVMLIRGGIDAAMMRLQQVIAVAPSTGYLSPEHFQQIFSGHGTIMIFFVGMPLMFGIANLLVPLMLGSRDLAFPFLNSVSFWLFVSGAGLMMLSLVVGDFSTAGWLAYPPLSELAYSPGVGVDYWLWALQISGIGSLLSGINFIATIIKKRAPGMTLMRMPMYVWTVFGAMALVVAAFPVLTVTLTMLFLDRYIGMHFFTSGGGGNMMMYVNLIWTWGHPEVYVLALPGFGIFSEIVATFSGKRLFGYTSMVVATMCITILSFLVWLHHFFTMGASANVNAFFGIMTMIIAVPTGVKMFNWVFTMYRGRVRFVTPMYWFLGFLVLFTIGGMTGVLLAIPPADLEFHNSLFLVAHFHMMIISGVIFADFAALTYWVPKFFGVRFSERWGKGAFWGWTEGFLLAFIPLFVLGAMGATRRLDHYPAGLGWQPLFIVAGIGVIFIIFGGFCQIMQISSSISTYIKARKAGTLVSDGTMDDPWNGRTLEWSVPSPAPFYNFAKIPLVTSRDAFWEQKHVGIRAEPDNRPYEDIIMPRSSGYGFLIGTGSFVLGFGIIWHIWWIVVLASIGIIWFFFMRMIDEDTEFVIPAAEVERLDTRATV